MAANGCEFAVIFKSISESDSEDKDAYYEILRSSGFQVALIPVLDFEFVNLDLFFSKINRPDDYEGVIFTSPRCVAGFDLAIKAGNNPQLAQKWRNHTNFVVGEKTAKVAENLGLTVKGQEAGLGDKLVEIMAKDKYSKPFLYPMGSLTQKGFKLKLKEHNIEADDTLIYKTKPHPDIKLNLEKIKSDIIDKVNYFIYFSPSGVNFSLPIMNEFHFDLNRIRFVAIGPTTKTALLDNGLEVAAVAAKPNPEAVLEAILSLRTKTSQN